MVIFEVKDLDLKSVQGHGFLFDQQITECNSAILSLHLVTSELAEAGVY